MNISRFMTHIDSMARQNRFEVDIFAPAIQLKMRSIRCQKATMPGKTLEVETIGYVPAGWKTNHVKSVTYPQEVTLTFMCNETMVDREKIELWQNYMYNDDYSMRYPQGETGYNGTVVVRQLDRGGNIIYEVQLEDAFPQSLGALTLDMGSAAIQTFDVTFNYRTWHSAYENSPDSSILGMLFKKGMRKIRTKVRRKGEDKLFKEGRTSLSGRMFGD